MSGHAPGEKDAPLARANHDYARPNADRLCVDCRGKFPPARMATPSLCDHCSEDRDFAAEMRRAARGDEESPAFMRRYGAKGV